MAVAAASAESGLTRTDSRSHSQWQELNPVPHFFETHQRSNQDEIVDRVAYGYP
jgi:hypothetical protein